MIVIKNVVLDLLLKTIINMDSTLLEIFEMYSHKKPELNNGSFVKVFKDSKLVNSKLKAIDLDIIFSKIKSKGK